MTCSFCVDYFIRIVHIVCNRKKGALSMGIKKIVVDKTRRNFIKLCNEADIPRMAKEVYPSDVRTVKDLSYIDDGKVEHKFDIYFPEGVSFENMSRKVLVLDIHGGGFVYGLKEINMNFNMHVARRTGLPVASINYTLVPDGSIVRIVDEIIRAIDHLKETYGIEDFYIMGDSAGGFLAYTTWAVLTDKDVRHDYQCFTDPKVNVLGIVMISPATTDSQKYMSSLEAAYFPDDPHNAIPSYAGNLVLLTDRCKFAPPSIVLITSDKDSMHDETNYFHKELKARDLSVKLFDGVTAPDGNPLYHVFPVGHPEWPESDEPLRLIAELVV